jgi:hypothetical protein
LMQLLWSGEEYAPTTKHVAQPHALAPHYLTLARVSQLLSRHLSSGDVSAFVAAAACSERPCYYAVQQLLAMSAASSGGGSGSSSGGSSSSSSSSSSTCSYTSEELRGMIVCISKCTMHVLLPRGSRYPLRPTLALSLREQAVPAAAAAAAVTELPLELKNLFYSQQEPVNLALLSDATRILCGGGGSADAFDPAVSFMLLQGLRQSCLWLSLCSPVLGAPPAPCRHLATLTCTPPRTQATRWAWLTCGCSTAGGPVTRDLSVCVVLVAASMSHFRAVCLFPGFSQLRSSVKNSSSSSSSSSLQAALLNACQL